MAPKETVLKTVGAHRVPRVRIPGPRSVSRRFPTKWGPRPDLGRADCVHVLPAPARTHPPFIRQRPIFVGEAGAPADRGGM